MHEPTQTHRRVVFWSGCFIFCSLMTLMPGAGHAQTPPPEETPSPQTAGEGAAAEPPPRRAQPEPAPAASPPQIGRAHV